MTRKFLIAAILLSTVGCTSFRTTALYRFANDSIAPQQTNKKLKGLPVKLKVPSHVQVTVYEQQVILANTDSTAANTKEVAQAAAAEVQKKTNDISKLTIDIDNKTAELAGFQQLKAKLESELASGVDAATSKAINDKIADIAKKIVQANISLSNLEHTKLETEPKLLAELQQLKAVAEVAARDAAIKYTLVSFSPPQYIVERDLQYTDKVFLVDFKRPAGGILDLTEASMDDEQYFAKVKADITEQTLKDIGYALDKVASPLSKLGKKSPENKALPTSSETPVAETNNNVNFQKSVIATQRFDISEAGWEERLQAFVSEFIAVDNGQSGAPGIPVEIGPEYSEGHGQMPAPEGHWSPK